MKKNLLIAFALALLVPLATNAQSLGTYTFSTGNDATKWITVPATQPSLIAAGAGDYGVSTVHDIGFAFPFATGVYTKFSVNADGNLRFGNTVTGTSNYTTPFSTTNASANAPKINAMGCDGFLTDSGYVRKFNTVDNAGDSLLVVEFATSTYNTTSRNSLLRWQVQLYPNGDITIVFAAAQPPILPAVTRQCGMSFDGTDVWLVSASHVATHYTAGQSTTIAASTWPDANRYYTFTAPVITCPAPVVNLSGLTATEVTVNILPSGTESEWLYKLNNGDWTSAYTTNLLIDQLTANTDYTLTLRAYCGAGDSSFSVTTTFRTPCAAIEADSLPWTYGFEDASGTGGAATFNACLQRHTNSSTAYPYTSSTYKHSGTYALYYYSTSSYYSYITLPLFEEDLNELMLSFYAYRTSTATYGHYIVGVMTDPSDLSTFDTIATGQVGNAWELVEVPLAGYTGTGNYLAILSPNMSAASYLYIDDITVDYMPACVRPVSVAVSDITTTTATLTINDPTNNNHYMVYYGNDSVEVFSTSHILTDLNNSTVYSVSVVSICSDGTVTNPVTTSFTTLCDVISSLPWTDNFDALSTSVAPLCYGKLGAGSAETSTTQSHSPSNSLRFFGADGNNVLVLPEFSESINLLQLSIWTRPESFTNASCGSFSIGYVTSADSASTFVPMATYLYSSFSAMEEKVIAYDTVPTGARMALRHDATSTSWYWFVDDITVDYIPACPRVENIYVDNVTSESADIHWHEAGTATSWTVKYVEAGGSMEDAAIAMASDTVITLTSLTPNTTYDVVITPDCSAGVGGSNFVSFTTLCTDLDSLPYVQDFEGAATGTYTSSVFVNCMYRLNNGTQYFGYPYVGGSTYNHTTGGAKGLYWYNSTTTGTYGDYQYVILPGVDTVLYPVNTLKLTFWARPSSTSYSPQFQVGVMTDPTDHSTFQQVATVNVTASTTWQQFTTMLGNFTGAGKYIAIRAMRGSSSWYAYVDDISLEVAPTCPAVVSHNVTTTASAARITWASDPGFATTPDSYEVSYGYAADNLAGATTVTVNTPMLVLTGLTADTSYKVSIQPLCTEGIAPAHVFNFSTAMLPCSEWDTTGYGGPTDTVTVGNPGTSTTAYMPINNGYNYSYTQHLILPSHLTTTGPQVFSGIAFDYAYSQPMTHATNCLIYMGNTTRSSFTVTSPADSAFVPYSDLTLVYSGPLNCTVNGYNYFSFNQGAFSYDGTSNIVVAIVNNSGSYDGTSFTFRYETVSSPNPALTHRVYNNDTPYGPAQMDAARANQSYWRTNMKLLTGGGECLSQATCYAPAVTAVEGTDDNIEIAWIPGYQETSWDVDYRAADDSVWTNIVSSTSQTSYNMPMAGLQSNTTYIFRVSANCSDTTLAGTASFTTPCSYISIPFSYGFEDMPTGTSSSRPNILCWHHLNNATTYFGYPYVSSTSPHDGSRNLYWYASTTAGTYGDYEAVVLPPVDTLTNPVNTLMLSFWARPSSATYHPVFRVGVMTDPDDINTFQPVDTIDIAPGNTVWNYYEVTLDDYTGNGRYVAIRADRPTTTWYAYMDDISLELIPSCRRVEDVTATNIGQTTATISWNSNAANLEVQYGPAGFTIGTGTSVVVSGVDSVDITGLSSNNLYDVYVRAFCSATDTSDWSLLYQFRTSCGMISSLPFVEDFESQTTGSSSTTSAFIPCWTRLNNGTSYGGYPYVNSSTTYNHTTGGTKGLYWYAATTAGTYGDYMYIVLPQIDTDSLPINSLQLSFWARASSTSYNPVFEVGVMGSNTDTAFTSLATININGNTNWANYVVGLGGYTGDGSYIAIRALRPSSIWYAYVDDIMLEALPLCPRVEDIHTSVLLDSAIVYWSDTSSNAGWNVEYDTVPFTPGTGHMTAIHVTDTMAVLGGLDSATTYHVYIYPDCGTDVFYRHATFTTLAASPATVPYYCDFEDAGTNGWDILNGSQSNYWMVGNATNNGGTQSLYVTDNGTANTYSGNATYVFATRTFNLPAGGYICSYDWKGHGESSYDFLRAALVPSGTQLTPGDYSGFDNEAAMPVGGIALDGGYRLNLQDTWTTQVSEVTITTPGTYTMVFMWRNDGSVYNAPAGAIDNVSFVANTCPMVVDVHAASAGFSTISVDWTDVSSASQWQLRYRKYGTSTNTVMNVSSHPVTINNLDTLTSYVFSVRPICSATDTGSWCPETLLSTEFCDGAIAASTGAATGTNYYTPVNNYYHYSLTETIIDSAELAGIGDISAIAYNYAYSTAMTDKTNVTIWLQPTNKTVFASSSDLVVLDTTTAVQVYSGNLNCSQGWNYFALDTAYTWDGHSNLLVIVDDNSNGYNSSSYTFNSSACTGYKTLYWYSDSYNPDPTNATFSGSKSYAQYRATMKLVSCDGCSAPAVTSIDTTYSSITVNWSNSDNTELAIMEGAWNEAMVNNTVTAASGTYTFTGLTDSTAYSIGLRQMCDNDRYSNWTVVTVVTPVRPCFAPTNPSASDVTLTTATLSWTPGRNETAWDLHVMGEGYDQTFAVTTNPYTVTGLSYGVTYTFEVRANCDADVYSDWSTSASFTTLTCQPVTGVTVNPNTITANSAVVSWTAPQGATNFEIEYGMNGFNQGNGIIVAATGTSHTLTDLSSTTVYDVYVRTVCGEGVTSAWSSVVDFTTADGEGIDDVNSAAISLYPNPASSTVTLMGIEGAATVTVVDMNGRETGKWTVVDGTLTIDVTEMAQGAYFVRIVGEQVNAIRKLIVR